MFKRVATSSIIALLLIGSVFAQNPNAPANDRKLLKTVNVEDTEKKNKIDKTSRRKIKKRISKREIENVPVPFLLGDTTITIKSDRHDPIKIGMTAGGITAIEFPANDKFFAVHLPKNGDWIELDKSPSIASDSHLVLRAGKDLLDAKGGNAIVSAQMESGLMVTFWIYPAKYIWKQTQRVIVKYDRDAIVKERQSAGLAVNLFDREEKKDAKEETLKDSTLLPAPELEITSNAAPVINEKEVEQKKHTELARKILNNSKTNPNNVFTKWAKTVNSLSLSTRSFDLNANTLAVTLAIRNTSETPLRLIPGNPHIVIETVDDKGKSLQFTPIESTIETTATDNVISARSVVFYTFIYKPQILSKKQRLRISVAQTNAADDPAIADLSTHLK